MTKRQYVCRDCRRFTTKRQCPNCFSTNLSASWKGLVIINKVEDSEIAKELNITTPGKYALFVD